MFNNKQTIFFDRVTENCILSDNKISKIYKYLIVNNYNITTDSNNIDIVIIDLCGFKQSFLDESLKKIEFYLGLGKNIILFGCISKVFKDKFGSLLTYIDGNNINKIDNYFNYSISIKQIDFIDVTNSNTLININDYKKYNIISNLVDINKVGFISISDGCSLNCSYCNIKKIKGNTVSVKSDIILDKIRFELKKGKNHIYLLSDDCGSYGLDIGMTFADLLDKIFDLDENIKLYITNIYPLFVIKYYDRIKKYIFSNNIIFMVLPIQHTSDRILSLMNRNYSIKKLFIILKEIKEKSNIKLMNHIIFDYHEESMNEFGETLKLLKYYDKTVYIRYSDVNNLFGKNIISYNLKEKVILLKKLQKKFAIDDLEIVL